MADEEEAGMAAPRPRLEQLPWLQQVQPDRCACLGPGRQALQVQAAAAKQRWEYPGNPGSLRRWSRPGHSFPCQQVITQSVTPGRYCETFAATETPPQPLCQAHQPVPQSWRVVGNMAHTAFSRNVLSGHVSEPHALGQAGCSCLTASCHATAPQEGSGPDPMGPSIAVSQARKPEVPPATAVTYPHLCGVT